MPCSARLLRLAVTDWCYKDSYVARINILRRPGGARYYARLGVPKDLRLTMGKRELWKSLGTSDPKEARSRAAPILAQWHADFAELRKRREPTEADLAAAVWDHYRSELEHDRNERLALPIQAQIDGAQARLIADVEGGKVQWSDDPLVQLDATADFRVLQQQAPMAREFRSRRLLELRKHLARGETATIEWAADDVIQREGLLIERGSPAYRDLCHRLQRAQLEALERAGERDQGDWTGSPRDKLVKPPLHLVSDNMAAPGESIMELFARFMREKSGAVSADTWDQNRKIVKLFAEFVGETAHVSAIRRKTMRDWKDMLFQWPVKAGETKVFAGMSFRKVIEANEKEGKPPISHKTINKYLSALGGFTDWLFLNEFIHKDVMKGMYLNLDRNERKRLPYTSDQLTTIFSSPLFTGCAGDKHEHEAGKVLVRDWRYWIPLIGLFTGARLGEIAQLLTDDVRQIHGVWVFHITREGSRLKSTKTAGSERVVPIHPELIKLGFIAYHATIKGGAEAQLFPELKRDARGFFSGVPSGFFNDYVRAIGVKIDKAVNFHSFRHGIADAFRRGGYLDEQFGLLLGHTKASTTGRYGIIPEGILSERVKMIEAVTFPGLTLAHLHPC